MSTKLALDVAAHLEVWVEAREDDVRDGLGFELSGGVADEASVGPMLGVVGAEVATVDVPELMKQRRQAVLWRVVPVDGDVVPESVNVSGSAILRRSPLKRHAARRGSSTAQVLPVSARVTGSRRASRCRRRAPRRRETSSSVRPVEMAMGDETS